MSEIGNYIIIAMFVQAVVQALKPVDEGTKRYTAPEIISILIGVIIAVAAGLNMLAGIVPDAPIVLEILFRVMTGVGIGRGPSFLHDLWGKLKTAGE